MKNILIPLAALSLAACTPSKVTDKALQYAREQVDTTDYVRRQLTAAAFHTLTFDSFGEFRFVQGKDTTVRIDVAAHPDYISRVEALTADSVLAIRMLHDRAQGETEGNDTHQYFLVTVTAPVPRTIELDGAGYVDLGSVVSRQPLTLAINGAGNVATAQLETPALTVVLDGAGNASLPAVATGALSVAINGAGNITLGGMASSADLSVEGVGHIDASQLSVSGQTRQDVAGAGVITVKE